MRQGDKCTKGAKERKEEDDVMKQKNNFSIEFRRASNGFI
jgi:hypothetical protein